MPRFRLYVPWALLMNGCTLVTSLQPRQGRWRQQADADVYQDPLSPPRWWISARDGGV